MSYTCNFCNNNFKTNSLLGRHKETANYCLKIQASINTKNFECKGCLKIFTNKRNCDSHINKCAAIKITDDLKKKLSENEEIITELQDKVKELGKIVEIYKSDHECVQEIAKQPKINNNNTINNNNNKYMNITPFMVSQRDVERVVNLNFTEDIFLEGQKGLADFTFKNLLLDDNGVSKYVCKDVNRGNFAYKNEKGDIEIDYKADNLINIIHNDLVKKSETYKENGLKKSEEFDDKNKYLNNMIEIKQLKKHSSKFVNRLSILTSRKHANTIIEKENDIEKSLVPIEFQYMIDQSKFLSEEYVSEGIAGYVRFARDYSFKNRVYCSDKNKQVLTYKVQENDEIRFMDNVGGVKICIDFFKSIHTINMQIIDSIQEKLLKQLPNDDDDEENQKTDEECDVINNLYYDFSEQSKKTKELYLGIENDFLHEFIDEFCL